MIRVKFLPSNKLVEVPVGATVLQAAITAGEHVESTCGGRGTCGKCKVLIPCESTSEASQAEKKLLSSGELAAGWALACQRILKENTEVRLQESKEVFERKTGLNSVVDVVIAPSVRKYKLVLNEPSVDDQIPDWDRMVAALPVSVQFSRAVATGLPQTLRQGAFRVTAVVDGESLLAVEPGDTLNRCFGLAIDIGTTTLVVYLMDLDKGKVVASGALTNPQQVFGADVIARISHASGGAAAVHQLQKKAIEGLNTIIARLCKEARISAAEIYQAVIVGNTTMSHLFLSIDPTYLGPAPFVPVFRQAVEVEAQELGLNILGTSRVIVLPNVAGYVGSDTVGVMLAARVDRLAGVTLAVDIGTNGEIVLVGRDRILTCSTAAGPAFEGAEIKCGMRAAEGAIESIQITDDVQLTVIGNTKARGICGSGLIDAVAEMVKSGVIEPSGRMAGEPEHLAKLPPALRERLRKTEQGSEFVLAWSQGSAAGEDITITQKDVRELQLAKAAIAAGINIMLRELGIGPEQIDRVLLAGAFGNYIKKESALIIGLLPSVPPERISSIGNAAGDGAKVALLSSKELARASALASRAEHLELSTRSEFQEEFVDSLSYEIKEFQYK